MDRRQRWKAENPTRAWAQQQIRRAVRAGYLQRPTRCQWCEQVAKVVGYARDVRRPVQSVWWICHWCRYRLKEYQEGREVPMYRLRPAPEPEPEPPNAPPLMCLHWDDHQPCGRPGRYRDEFGNGWCGYHKPNRKKRKPAR